MTNLKIYCVTNKEINFLHTILTMRLDGLAKAFLQKIILVVMKKIIFFIKRNISQN